LRGGVELSSVFGAGATIMGDGAVALILDMHKLTQQAQKW